MRRTRIDKLLTDLPQSIGDFIKDAVIYDSSSSPEARVYFIDKEDGFYLKIADRSTLEREVTVTKYFHSIGYGAQVIDYVSEKCDFMLSRRMRGEDLTSTEYLNDPKRLARVMGEELRRLHETDFSACPIKNVTEEYLDYALGRYIDGNYDKSHFPDSFGYRSPSDAISVLRDGLGELKCDALIHGDYCLPNIIFDKWRLSGFIDLGGGGVGDRHIDLFWGAWTLGFNLGTDGYRDTFFDAYGRDKIDQEKLKIIAAREVFG